MKPTTLAVLLAACAPVGPSEDAVWTEHPGVREAHEAYVAADWPRMTSAIRGVLADGGASAAERANVLEVLEKGYEASEGRLPAEWTLPPEIVRVTLSQQYVAHAGGRSYRLKLKASAARRDTLKRLAMTRHPDEVVVLDSDSATMERNFEQDDDGMSTFAVTTPDRDQPEQEGLYGLTFELASGTVVEGWTILSKLASTATPTLREPSPDHTYVTRTPRFAWEDFRSPQYAPFEKRNVLLYVGSWEATRDPQWLDVWSVWVDEPSVTETHIGDPRGAPATGLADGRYNLGLMFHEHRVLGPVRLRRTSQTTRSFTVVER